MLTVEDLVPPGPLDWAEPVPPPPELLPVLAAATPRPPRARRVLRPALWAMAVVYLVVDRAGRALGSVLDAYVRGTDAAGRAVLRAGRAVLRWLGPLGRLVRRVVAPVARLLVRLWDRVSVWLLLRMFRPLGRWARALWARCHPLLERLLALVQRMTRCVEPVLRALTSVVDAVEAAAARLGVRWRRTWAPVVRLARELGRPRRR